VHASVDDKASKEFLDSFNSNLDQGAENLKKQVAPSIKKHPKYLEFKFV